jgi:hypothetical protein
MQIYLFRVVFVASSCEQTRLLVMVLSWLQIRVLRKPDKWRCMQGPAELNAAAGTGTAVSSGDVAVNT